MAATARYVPHSEQTKIHYERFLRDLRRWLPPGLDDSISEIAEETLSILCQAGYNNNNKSSTAAGAISSGGTSQLQQVRKQLESLFDTSLSAEALHEVLQYGRLIDDFVATNDEVENNNNNNNNNYNYNSRYGDFDSVGGTRVEDGLGDLLLLQEEENDDQRSSSDDENGEKTESKLKHDNRKDLMKFAADVEGILDDDIIGGGNNNNNNDDDDENENDMITGNNGRVNRVTFEEVACNPNYIRDSLRRLFPTQTIEACELQANRVLQYAEQQQVDQLTLETQLTAFLGGYDDESVMDWIGTIAASRWAIVYGMKFSEGSNQEEKNTVMDHMKLHAQKDRTVERLYQSITGKEIGNKVENENDYITNNNNNNNNNELRPLKRLDLQAYAFKDERTPHQHTRAVVPRGTQRAVYETHDEVILPPSSSSTVNMDCISLSAFPEWAKPVFPGVSQLNPMQSKTFPCAFNSDENMLVCAPTGAGKTNVAMMAMLRAISNATTKNGSIKLRELKMVYVAPMKALVQEVVRTFSKRLEPLGLTVMELSGDSNVNQSQLSDAQLIVTTPEKWDVVTRKSVELGVASLLKLLILDEVHLLHNERGPVLEAIVARTLLQQQLRGEAEIRIVGLSATLPNHMDVASFLQVDRQRGLFVFDSSFRPIPLQQSFCAIKKVRGTNQAAVMNLVAYDKVLQAAINGEQTMVFVHSRKDTEYTAMYMMRRVAEDKRGNYFVRSGSESEKLLRETASDSSHILRLSLQQLLPMGFAIHHAGMSREERQIVESLFEQRHVRVLVCTSTLAWGVNLPANQVIIKGTRVFNGSKGETELLSALDVLQMFGRAGRVGFGSTLGKASVITSADDLQYYLSVLNDQLPIESQMMKRVVDMLNAEIVLGHIESISEGVRWLQRTYMYVRIRRAPEMYGTKNNSSDPLFLRHLENIIHTAADDLRRCQMVEYDSQARRIAPTPYGRIASFYYITSTSMATYLTHLSSTMHDVDLFRLFAMSKEFSHITVRTEEQSQLQYLLENAPIAVRESRYTPLAKINILLQCYISDMSLQGLPLMSELVYVKDSAQRILRALYETCLVREYGRTAQQILQICLMTVHQQWSVQSPVRQLRHTIAPKSFNTFIHALESRRISWEEVRAWSLEDISEKLGDERRAELAYDCIHQVPHFSLEAAVRPLTRNMLYVDVDITPDFTYNETLHGKTAGELILTIELMNGRILHHEKINFKTETLRSGETLSAPTIVVPIVEPKPTHYFIRCQSLHWLGSECSAAVCLMNVRLPEIAPPLLEINLRPPLTEDEAACDVSTALQSYGLEIAATKVFPFTEFFPTQRDLIEPIMQHPNENIFAALPPGNGKTVIAELFIMHFMLECALLQSESNNNDKNTEEVVEIKKELINDNKVSEMKLLYLTAHEACATRRYHEWRFKFGESLQQRVIKLEPFGEELEIKIKKVQESNIIIASGNSLTPLLRRGATNCLSGITHIIVDHIHLIRAPEGRWVEECLARLQSKPYIVNNKKSPARLLALSYPLISCTEVSRWMKISNARQYNYGNSYRQLRVRLEAVEHAGARSRYEAATVSTIKLLQRERYASTPSVIFVPTVRDAQDLAKRILVRCRDFIPNKECDDVEDRTLALLLTTGIAYMHRGTSLLDELIIMEYVEKPARHPETNIALPLILICTFESAWRLPAALFGTSFICAAERVGAIEGDNNNNNNNTISTTDCTVSELLQMSSRALNESIIYCRAARRWVWSRLLNDPLPLESHLRYPDDFRDTINAAIAEKRVTDMPSALRILQSHYFLHHLRTNLHFYGVPSREDIPAYASEFARSVINSLKDAGCIKLTGGENNNDNENNDINEEEFVIISPTRRGIAAAHHGISIESLENITENSLITRTGTVADMWRLIASSCLELTPQYVGDAARITDIAELQALQTIARALPTGYDVRYIDLDFSKGWTKVLLLIFAHCARMFVSVSKQLGEEDENKYNITSHPLDSPSSAAIDLHFLLDIPQTIAERLREDLHVLLPAVLELVRGTCEMLDSKTQWKNARYLMRLSSQIERRVWGFESSLLQIPCVQENAILREVLISSENNNNDGDIKWSLEKLQELSLQGALAEETWIKLSHKLQQYNNNNNNNNLRSTINASSAEALIKRLRIEAAALPRVTSLKANGTISEMNGVYAFVIHVEGHITCTLPSSSSSSFSLLLSSNDETLFNNNNNNNSELGPWWVSCVLHSKGNSESQERLIALRVTTPEPTTDMSSNEESEISTKLLKSSQWILNGALSFPLHEVDGEDLEKLSMTASIISARYRADAEVDVVFTTE